MVGNRKIYREGQVFGKLTAIKYVKGKKYLCICKCGNEKTVSTNNLINGQVRSCGCLRSIDREDYNESIKQKIKSSIKISSTGCWEWQKATHKQGYGQIAYKRKCCLAHRISWIVYKGPLSEDILVCHKCDNPSCCNPDHLFLGTDKENMQDCVKKNRLNSSFGSRQWCSKLNEKDIVEIRKLFKEGKTQRDIALMYKIHHSTVAGITLRTSWKHVP